MGAEAVIAGVVPPASGRDRGSRRGIRGCRPGAVFTAVNELFNGLYNPIDRLNGEVRATERPSLLVTGSGSLRAGGG